MPALSTVAYTLGGILLLFGVWAVLAPGAWRRFWLGLPRSRPAAFALTAIALGWCAWIILNAYLGRFDGWKPAIYVIAPAIYYLLITYLDELLASRAVGGLMLLAANPMFYSARLWDGTSSLRYVIPVAAYAIVLVGVVFVMSPYRLRRCIDAMSKTDARCRASGAAWTLAGGFVVALGVLVY
ncbi:MAG TPA: hypothetical protein VIH35_08800 [Kiritimatiellia bacterium]